MSKLTTKTNDGSLKWEGASHEEYRAKLPNAKFFLSVDDGRPELYINPTVGSGQSFYGPDINELIREVQQQVFWSEGIGEEAMRDLDGL